MYETLMEQAVADENYELALAAVKRNHGAAGIDRMTTTQLDSHLQANWWILKDKLMKEGGGAKSPSLDLIQGARPTWVNCCRSACLREAHTQQREKC